MMFFLNIDEGGINILRLIEEATKDYDVITDLYMHNLQPKKNNMNILIRAGK